MRNKIISFYVGISLVAAAFPVLASPQPQTAATLETNGTSRQLFLPPAADNSPVISLGESIDPATGKIVEGFMFIHDKKTFAKPEGVGKPKGGDQCYAFLAKDARWKMTEGYIFNSENTRGLDEATLHALLAKGVNTWDDQTTFDVFGDETAGIVDGADNTSPDGKNEVYFADIDGTNTIAVTIVWGIFYGPLSQREIVEWDMVFDDVTFDWSAEEAGVTNKMDFLNIAVHEIGHAAGMGHPSDTCTEETMYRYADFGEIKKRDLHTGDIAGIKALYK